MLLVNAVNSDHPFCIDFNAKLSTIGILCFSGSVPLDPQLSSSLEEGKDFIQSFPNSATFSAISSICQTLLNNLGIDWRRS